MRARVERSALDRALKIVKPAVTSKAHLPVLTCVRIDAGGGLVLSATDLDLCIETTVPAEVLEDGTALVDAALLGRFVHAASDGAVEFHSSDAALNVSAGEAVMSMPTWPTEQWPQIPVTEGEPAPLDADTFAAAAAVAFAARPENDPNHEQKGVWFHDGYAVALDGYRLAAARLDVEVATGCVPAPVLRLVSREATEGLELSVDHQGATFTTGDTAWTTRLIVSPPKPWQTYFDCDYPHHLSLDPGDFLVALKRVAVVHEWVRLSLEGDKLTLSASEVDVGEISDRLPASGELPYEVIVKVGYLTDAVEAHDASELTIRFRSERAGFTIQGDRISQAIMPINPSAVPKACGKS